jgi:hypothetical protein
LTGGIWRKSFDQYRNEHGIADALIHFRKKRVCPAQCSKCGHSIKCPLLKAHDLRKRKYNIVRAIKKCPLSTPAKFEEKYMCRSKFFLKIENILERGYNNWNLCPLFVQTPQKISKIPTRLSLKKKKCSKVTKPKSNNLEKLFG